MAPLPHCPRLTVAELVRAKLIGAYEAQREWQCTAVLYSAPTLSLHIKKEERLGHEGLFPKLTIVEARERFRIAKPLTAEKAFQSQQPQKAFCRFKLKRQRASQACFNKCGPPAASLPTSWSQGWSTFTHSFALPISIHNLSNWWLIPPETPQPVMNHTNACSFDGFSMQQTT